MIDFRLYRLAFIPALIAVVIGMFSLEGAPAAREAATPPTTFDGDRAATEARRIAAAAPDRTPGSAGDERVAELVRNRFEEIPAGAVSEQEFEADYEGERVSLRNIILTLPGDGASTVAVIADRDSARGPGAATSASATGVLIELANALGVAGHEKTYVLASTSGGAAAGAGARELVAGLPERASIEALIVISQPGASEQRPPFAITSSTGPNSGSVQLERTAEAAVEAQAQRVSTDEAAFTQLARLAFPSGLGSQAPLVDAGYDAVAISAAGERQLPGATSGTEEISGGGLDAFGRAIQATVGAVDISTTELVHGPDAHLQLSGNLIAGWNLALLGLTLLLPAAVAAVDGIARARRRGDRVGGGLAWAVARSLPFVGALAALYGLAVVGAIPRPEFPFDPGLYGLGTRAAVTLPLIVIAGLVSALLLVRRGVGAAGAPPASLAAVGVVAVAACAALWFANPYLALLAVPAAHVWLLATGRPGVARGALTALAALVSIAPLIAALAAVSGALDLGATAPWTWTLIVADGQLGLAVVLAGCFLAGALLGSVTLAAGRREV